MHAPNHTSKMIKKMTIFGFLFLSLISFAQEIDIKRGKILLDETPIALIDKEKRGVYYISTLEEEPIFSVTNKVMPVGDGKYKYWYEIASLKTKKKNELPIERFSFGLRKNIAANLVKGDYPFLTINGIDKALLKKFTEGPSTGVSARFKQQKEKGKEYAHEIKDLAQVIYIDEDNKIYFKNQWIGSIVQKNKKINGQTIFKYLIYDLDGFAIAEYRAKLDPGDFFDPILSSEISTIDGKHFTYEWQDSTEKEVQNDPNAKKIIAILLHKGYKLKYHWGKILLEQERIAAQKRAEEKKRKAAEEKAHYITTKREILTSLMKNYAYFNLISSNDLTNPIFVSENLINIKVLTKSTKSTVNRFRFSLSSDEYDAIMGYLDAFEILGDAEMVEKVLLASNLNSPKLKGLIKKMDTIFKEALTNIIQDNLKGGAEDFQEFLLLTKVNTISNLGATFVGSTVEVYRKSLLESLNVLVQDYGYDELTGFLNYANKHFKKYRTELKTKTQIDQSVEHYHDNAQKYIDTAMTDMLIIAY